MTVLSPALPTALDGWAPPSADPAAIRSAARVLRREADEHADAAQNLAVAGQRLAARWSGAAAGDALSSLSSLAQEVSSLGRAHELAASVLDCCAGAVEDALATWRRAEALERQDVLERASSDVFAAANPADASPLRRTARRLAQESHEQAAAATARAAAALDELAGSLPRTPAAPRLPLTPAEQLVAFGHAPVEAVWETVVLGAELSPHRLVVDRQGWLDELRTLADGVQHAATHPREAVDATLGLDQLRDGEYGAWLGALVPDLLSGAFSGGSVPLARRSAHVAHELEELAEDVHDLQRVTRHLPAETGGPVELRDGVHAPDGYVLHIEDLSPERRTHILDGDPPREDGKPSGGGHRAGTGKPNKTEFPPDWDDDTIIRAVLETARRPDRVTWSPQHEAFQATAHHDGVDVLVSVTPQGTIRTAYPLPGGRAVVKNKKAKL